MSNLVKHAKRELEIIGAFSEDGDFYGGMIGDAVIELIEVFSKQGHSGMSAGIVRNLFNKLANFDNVSPLTFNDDEWSHSYGETYQNKRNSAVFKDGKDGRPHFIDAYSMVADGISGGWNGSVRLLGNKRVRKCYIKDPSNMPELTIKLNVTHHSDDASDWDFDPAHENVLDELKEYYDVEIVDIND